MPFEIGQRVVGTYAVGMHTGQTREGVLIEIFSNGVFNHRVRLDDPRTPCERRADERNEQFFPTEETFREDELALVGNPNV